MYLILLLLEQLAHLSVDLSTVAGMVYDTTASNSGWNSGEKWRLGKEVGHAILGLECRKHAQDLHAKVVFGGAKSPSKSIYKKKLK